MVQFSQLPLHTQLHIVRLSTGGIEIAVFTPDDPSAPLNLVPPPGPSPIKTAAEVVAEHRVRETDALVGGAGTGNLGADLMSDDLMMPA